MVCIIKVISQKWDKCSSRVKAQSWMVDEQVSNTILCLNYKNAKCSTEIQSTFPDALYLLPWAFNNGGPRQ